MNQLPHTPDDALLLREVGWLHGLARRLVSDATLADDALQEAWLSAQRSPPRHNRTPRAWWATVVRNSARQITRSEHSRAKREEAVARSTSVAEAPVDIVARAEMHERLVQAVLALDEPYRRVLLWRYLDEREPTEIARLLDVPAGTVRSQLKRGLERLRARLDEDSGGNRRAWVLALIPLTKPMAGLGAASATAAGGVAVSLSTKITLAVVTVGLVLLAGWLGWNQIHLSDRAASRDSSLLGAEAGAPATDPEDAGEDLPSLATREGPPKPKLSVTAPAQAEGHARIAGDVVDLAGSALSGVAISLHREEPSQVRGYEAGAALALLNYVLEGTGPALAKATSDTAGRFTFEGLDPTRNYRIRAWPQKPHVEAEVHAQATSKSGPRVRLVLGHGKPLTLHLVDVQGVGRAGSIQLHMRRPVEPADHRWASGVRQTDAHGKVTLPSVPAGALEAHVKVPGLAERQRIPLTAPAGGDVRLVLGVQGGASVFGTVRDAQRAPIAGATIIVRCGEQQYQHRPALISAATSDQQGRYRLVGLPAGYLLGMDCVADGFVRPTPVYYARVISTGEELQMDFDLEAGSYLRGRVLTIEGHPVPNARVQTSVFTTQGIAYQLHVQADSEGVYALGPLPQGQGVATPQAHGYVVVPPEKKQLTIARSIGHSFRLSSAGQEERADLLMRKGSPIGGRVVDSRGTGLAGTTVRLMGPADLWPEYGPAFETVAADVTGAFMFPGLPERDAYSVRIADGKRRLTASIEPGAPNVVTLPDGASISGRVIWTDAGPILGGAVTISQAGVRRDQRILIDRPDGSFESSQLRAGKTSVRVLDAFGRPSGEGFETTLRVGQQVSGIELRPQTLHAIEGRVTSPDGSPRAGHVVSISTLTAPPSTFTVRADGTGRFYARGLPQGSYTLSGEGISKPQRVASGSRDAHLIVDQTKPVLRGMVLLLDGSPLPRGNVRVAPAQAGIPGTVHMVGVRSGSFQHELPMGVTTVEVALHDAFDGAGRRVNARSIKVHAPVDKPLTLKLEAGRRLKGLVVDETGAGIAGATVAAHAVERGLGTSFSNRPEAQTDASGAFELVGLEPETTLRVNLAQVPSGWILPPSLVVGVDEESVRIVLKPGGDLSGRVVDADGTPIDRATVTWSHKAGYAHGRCGADGHFVVSGVPTGHAGTLRVTVHGIMPGAPVFLPRTIEDVVAGTRDLMIRLELGEVLTGKVVDPTGKAVPGARVTADGDGWMTTVGTAPDGTFRFAPVASGPCTLSTEGASTWIGAAPIQVRIPTKPVVLTLRKGHNVTGTLLGKDTVGVPVRFVVGRKTTEALAGAGGAFLLALAETTAGTLVVIDTKNNRYAILENVGPPSERLEVSLQEGRRIAGQITGATKGVRIRVSASAGSVRVATVANAKGEFELAGLPPGTYRLDVIVLSRGGARLTREDVAAGTVDLILPLP